MKKYGTTNLDAQQSKFQKFIKLRIRNFLKRYCFNQQLDIIKVMDIIPGDWIVSSSDDENGVFGFLASVISFQLNQRRVMACARNVAEMDLLNVET